MKSNMAQNIRSNIFHTAVCLISLLILLFIYVSYIQIIEGPALAAHPLNRRTIESAGMTERGMILDRQGEKLAFSERDSAGAYHRKYPYGAVMAHIIGYDSITYGKAGIESAFNNYLSGLNNPGHRLGAITHLWQNSTGNNVILTIDANLQREAYKALGEYKGAVIAISPRTGAILAMVSKPSFDPNQLDQDWETISKSMESPLLNRVLQGLYPPGSTIKIMIAEAALAEKIVDAKTEFTCTGSLQVGSDYILPEANFKAHGKLNLEKALAVSCNVTFGQLALRLGRDKMAKTFERYGFNQSFDGDLQETNGKLPDFSKLSDGDLAQTGIGQGSLLVTPLRMAMLAGAFANKGIIKKPYIVSQITAPDGSIIQQFVSSDWLKPVSPILADEIRKMMVSVVNEGTGSAASLSGITVAGKTGTAENSHGASHAWFVGFAPADNPEIVVAVIVENAGSGGGIAAPVARQVMALALH